ncbi:MAG: glycosyltransferase family 2 protein [Ilumatobacter sp.]|jgi:glycosyltransferase involved in cell wall biosynthesis|uniref:glycosyltransferase family 2 protein n=1 Tax=Ilumatobacter sp. TaxID=1967498 RepID=UPI00391E0045
MTPGSDAPSEPRPLLSAAIIVKDEADLLRGCLTTIADVCDEIIVVDTGSSDDSVAVAASFGAVQALHPWEDDFAAARNRALELATGRWILYIDADEQLEAPDPAAIRDELLRATDAVALRVWFRARPIWSPYREFRVWRHRPDVRFVGRIHETMVPDLRRIEADEGLAVHDSAHLRITHHGYEGDQTAKHRRNLPLLEARVRELPDRCYLWNHLGNVREALGDVDGARHAWQTGIDVIRRNGLTDRTDVLCYAGYALSSIANGRDVAALVDEMWAVCPWYRTIDWIAAKNHATQHRPSLAIPHLRRLIDTGIDPLDDSLAYNNDMFASWAWTLLADCQLALGDVRGAAATMSEAAVANPNDAALRTAAVALAARVRRRP